LPIPSTLLLFFISPPLPFLLSPFFLYEIVKQFEPELQVNTIEAIKQRLVKLDKTVMTFE